MMHAPIPPIIALLALFAALCMSGCSNESGASLLPQIGQKAPDTYKPGKAYQMTAEERSLDCKRLTGRMQVRILQIRDASERDNANAVVRGLHSTLTPVLGGTSYGVDRQADFARDRAVLDAMNRQLAEKKCPTYELDTELRPRSIRDTPTPVPKGMATRAP